MSTSSDESESSESSQGSNDDAKMRTMLSEWDTKEPSESHDVFVDSDSDNEDGGDDEKRMALLKAGNSREVEESEDEEEEGNSGEVEESEDEEEEEEGNNGEVEGSENEEEEEASEGEEDEAMPEAMPEAAVAEISESEPSEEEEEVSNPEAAPEEESESEVTEGEGDAKPRAAYNEESESEMTEGEEEESEADESYEGEIVVEGDGNEVDDEDKDNDEDEELVVTSISKEVIAVDDDEEDVIDDGNIEDTLKKKPKKKKVKTKLEPITAVTTEDTEEDAAMKALLSQWGGDDNNEDDDDDSDDDEDSEVSEREVQLEDNVIDHIVLAAPDLDEAMVAFEKMTGISPVIAGSINGLGIKSARISFNDSSYIEIIAPDPKQAGPIGQLLKSKGITELTPFHFAIRSSKTEQLKDEVKKFGYVPDHISMFGGQKDGVPRKWEMLYLYGHKIGGICPFFINWANSEHPCVSLPVVGKLKKFTIRAPEDDPVHKLLEHVAIKGFNIETGKTKLSFQFSSPEGTVKFATSKAVGFKFPGFDDEENELDVCVEDEEDVVFDDPGAPELLDVADTDYEALPPPVY
jgi:hypothetical protein